MGSGNYVVQKKVDLKSVREGVLRYEVGEVSKGQVLRSFRYRVWILFRRLWEVKRFKRNDVIEVFFQNYFVNRGEIRDRKNIQVGERWWEFEFGWWRWG